MFPDSRTGPRFRPDPARVRLRNGHSRPSRAFRPVRSGAKAAWEALSGPYSAIPPFRDLSRRNPACRASAERLAPRWAGPGLDARRSPSRKIRRRSCMALPPKNATGTITKKTLARFSVSCVGRQRPCQIGVSGTWGVPQAALVGDCPGKRPSARRERPFRGAIGAESGRNRGSDRRTANNASPRGGPIRDDPAFPRPLSRSRSICPPSPPRASRRASPCWWGERRGPAHLPVAAIRSSLPPGAAAAGQRQPVPCQPNVAAPLPGHAVQSPDWTNRLAGRSRPFRFQELPSTSRTPCWSVFVSGDPNSRPADPFRSRCRSPVPEHPPADRRCRRKSRQARLRIRRWTLRMRSCPLTVNPCCVGVFGTCGGSQASLVGDCPGKRPSARREGPFRGRHRAGFGAKRGV